MKKIILMLFAALAIAACAATGAPAPSLEQTVSRVCPPVKAVITVLENSPTVAPDLRQRIKDIEPVVFIACSGEIKADGASLHDLANQALPVLLQVVSAAPINDEQKNYAILAVAMAQAAIEAVPK